MPENNQDTAWQISNQFRSMYEQYTHCNWSVHFDNLSLIYGPIHIRSLNAIRLEVIRSHQSH